MIIITLLLLTLLGLLILSTIWIQMHKREKESYYEAAANILKEKILDSSIRNDISMAPDILVKEKGMIGIKIAQGKSPLKYVFDPEQPIYIGRQKEQNSIILPDPAVSGVHCCIYVNEGRIFLQDLQSSNGTMLKRKHQKILLPQGTVMEVMNKDVLQIGATRLKIILFYFDMSYI